MKKGLPLLTLLAVIGAGAAVSTLHLLERAEPPRSETEEATVPPGSETQQPASPSTKSGTTSSNLDQPESQALSEEDARREFRALAEETLGGLPTVATLRALPAEQVHQTPRAIVEAGFALGKIAETLQTYPALAEEGIRFYRDCATGSDFPGSIRALCYVDGKSLSARTGHSEADFTDGAAIPNNVRALAQRIPT